MVEGVTPMAYRWRYKITYTVRDAPLLSLDPATFDAFLSVSDTDAVVA